MVVFWEAERLNVEASNKILKTVEVWPPKSYTEIFFKSNNQDNEELYGSEIIEKFI